MAATGWHEDLRQLKKRREKTSPTCGKKKETSGAWQWTCFIVTEV